VFFINNRYYRRKEGC